MVHLVNIVDLFSRVTGGDIGITKSWNWIDNFHNNGCYPFPNKLCNIVHYGQFTKMVAISSKQGGARVRRELRAAHPR